MRSRKERTNAKSDKQIRPATDCTSCPKKRCSTNDESLEPILWVTVELRTRVVGVNAFRGLDWAIVKSQDCTGRIVKLGQTWGKWKFWHYGSTFIRYNCYFISVGSRPTHHKCLVISCNNTSVPIKPSRVQINLVFRCFCELLRAFEKSQVTDSKRAINYWPWRILR